jgi:hypothetical protein
MVELPGHRAAVRTILDWRRGPRRLPICAIEVLQEALKPGWDGKLSQSRSSKEKRLLGQPQRSTGDYKFKGVMPCCAVNRQ